MDPQRQDRFQQNAEILGAGANQDHFRKLPDNRSRAFAIKLYDIFGAAIEVEYMLQSTEIEPAKPLFTKYFRYSSRAMKLVSTTLGLGSALYPHPNPPGVTVNPMSIASQVMSALSAVTALSNDYLSDVAKQQRLEEAGKICLYDKEFLQKDVASYASTIFTCLFEDPLRFLGYTEEEKNGLAELEAEVEPMLILIACVCERWRLSLSKELLRLPAVTLREDGLRLALYLIAAGMEQSPVCLKITPSIWTTAAINHAILNSNRLPHIQGLMWTESDFISIGFKMHLDGKVYVQSNSKNINHSLDFSYRWVIVYFKGDHDLCCNQPQWSPTSATDSNTVSDFLDSLPKSAMVNINAGGIDVSELTSIGGDYVLVNPATNTEEQVGIEEGRRSAGLVNESVLVPSPTPLDAQGSVAASAEQSRVHES